MIETGLQKRRLIINAIMQMTQVIVNGCVLFILYRFLIHALGFEQLGIWSIVTATTSIANVANLGLFASNVKFVAKYFARGEEKIIHQVIQTSTVSIGVFIGLILLIAFPLAYWLLGLLVPTANLGDALAILPYTLLSLWIVAVSSTFQASLDGFQRYDLRNAILIISSLIYLFLSFIMVPIYGLMGLAYSQVIQAFILMAGSWYLLKRRLPHLPIISYHWDQGMFKEMVGYGIKFQAYPIGHMVFEFTSKALVTKFGGLTMVALYEMAARMLWQLRTLLVSANQVIVPSIANLQEKNPNLIQKVYRDTYQLMLFIALPFYSMIMALTPLISLIWIGHYETLFVLFSLLLAIGLFINTLSVPAYFSYLGIGDLKWNVLGHIAMVLLNAILGMSIGYLFGGAWVVGMSVVATVAGSLMIAVSFFYRYKLPFSEIFPRENIGLAAACLLAIVSSLYIHHQFYPRVGAIVLPSIAILVFAAIIIVPLWGHPMRKRIIGWISGELWNKKVIISEE
ncbi:MAG: oligosaccharide flippase family protein [Acidobacteriota bacterium]